YLFPLLFNLSSSRFIGQYRKRIPRVVRPIQTINPIVCGPGHYRGKGHDAGFYSANAGGKEVAARLFVRRRKNRGNGKSQKSSDRSEEHTSELQSRENLVCRLLLEKKK